MPAVRMGDSLCDREAEPGTTTVTAGAVGWLGRRAVDETLEEPIAKCHRHARSLVLHIDLHALIGGLDAHVDRAARRRMLERIVEQIQHEAMQQHAVPMNTHIAGAGVRHLQRDSSRLGQ